MKPKPKFFARSASDYTEDWPYWFISDSTGLNVTVTLYPIMSGRLPFLSKDIAICLAELANKELKND